MKNKKRNRKTSKQIIYSFLLSIILFFTNGITLFAQKPSNLPSANGEPVDFFGSMTNIVVYIVIPLIIVILYLIWRKRKIKEALIEKEKELEEKKKENEQADNNQNT